jgi:hypothetical protein
MLEKKFYWEIYWKNELHIEEELNKLRPCGQFDLQETWEHLLLFIFYLNMITSIFVEKGSIEGCNNQDHKVNMITGVIINE